VGWPDDHFHVTDGLVTFGDDRPYAEDPAAVYRIVLVGRDEVLTAAHPLAGLRPLQTKVIAQNLGGGVEVIPFHGCPEPADRLLPFCCTA
jgi:hypothetical protein